VMLLIVNGIEHEIDPGIRTLLDVLREDLGLVGAKEGCGIGMCGACTVLVDGRAISSCLMLAAQAVGKEIITIEGIAPQGELHPVQQAYIEHSGFQCAYCTPGFVLSTVALLAENPARIFGLRGKGRLEVGMDGDLVLIDPKARFKIDSSKFYSKAHFSPFDGFKCVGRPAVTMVAGHVVYDRGEIVEENQGKIVRGVRW